MGSGIAAHGFVTRPSPPSETLQTALVQPRPIRKRSHRRGSGRMMKKSVCPCCTHVGRMAGEIFLLSSLPLLTCVRAIFGSREEKGYFGYNAVLFLSGRLCVIERGRAVKVVPDVGPSGVTYVAQAAPPCAPRAPRGAASGSREFPLPLPFSFGKKGQSRCLRA